MNLAHAFVAVAVAAVAAIPGSPALAGPLDEPQGQRCVLGAGDDPFGDPGSVGSVLAGGPTEVTAGPVVSPGQPVSWDPLANPVTVTLTCSLQLGGAGWHTDPDVQSISSPPSLTVATVDPTPVTFFVEENTPAFVCTTVHTVDAAGHTATIHWDEATQTWSGDPSSALCTPYPQIYSSTVGTIHVDYVEGLGTAPVVTIEGYLANPLMWQCTVPSYNAGVPFTVSCLPMLSVNFTWNCAFLAASAYTTSTSGVARTRLDCDDDGSPEAQTATVSGIGDIDAAYGVSNVSATRFFCTVDDGSAGAGKADFHALCGDPGTAERR